MDLTTYLCGAFSGISALVVLLSLLIGYAYEERMLWWHATTLAVALPAQYGYPDRPRLAIALWALQLALAAQTLITAVGSTGALRKPTYTLRVLSLSLAVLIAVGVFPPDRLAWLLLPWSAAISWCLFRGWSQSRPWVYWLAIGQLALAFHWLANDMLLPGSRGGPLSLAALAVFGITTYLAMVWQSRLASENSLRIEARERTDPLTGLATPRVFSDRVDGALIRSRTLNYTSALMLIRVVNIDQIVADQGLEDSEAVILGASHAIASTLRAQDCAARLASNRFGVLAEGVAKDEPRDLATRILSRGLRGEEWGLRGSQLEFNIAIIEVGSMAMRAKAVLDDLELELKNMRDQETPQRIRTVLPRLSEQPLPA
jgi:GGDEF domain-containing protein